MSVLKMAHPKKIKDILKFKKAYDIRSSLNNISGEIKTGEKGIIDVIFDSTEKEASETVDVDMYLKNINPKSDSQYLFVLDYTFELVQ